MDVGQISAQLASRTDAIAKTLFPQGKRAGNEYCVGSVGGESGNSLRVHLTGDKAGVWADFATGEGGDLLDLYRAVKGVNLVEAIKWAKDYLGIYEPDIRSAASFGRADKSFKRPVVANVTHPQKAALDYLTVQRGLKAETLTAFQIGERPSHHFKREGHTCPAVVFPYKAADTLYLVKYLGTERPNDKKLIDAEPGCEPILFGWQALNLNVREVIIGEGEINAMSWHQYGFGALATPFGAGSKGKHNWIASEWERLEQFSMIYLSFDQDDAGREAVADLVERLGRERCRVIPPMPDDHKDINDCLFAGVGADRIKDLLQQARPCDPDELRSAVEFTDAVIEQFYPPDGTALGVPVPFSGYKDKLAFRRGEVTVITGKRGHGKTEGINWIVNKAIDAGERALIASFEMRAKILLARGVRQLTAQREPSTEYIRQAMGWYWNKLWVFDHVGSANQDRIFEIFDYAWRRYGITLFVIDSLMKCGIRSDDYPAQDAFADRYVNFCNTRNVHGILVAHANKGREESNLPTNDDVKGSGGITDQVHNVVGIWRNKRKEIAQQKLLNCEPLTKEENEAVSESDVVWYVDKQREGDGWIGRINLNFDPDSKQLFADGDAVAPLVPFNAPEGSAPEYSDTDPMGAWR